MKAAAQDLPNTDLSGPLFGHKRRHAKDAQAADHQGNDGEGGSQVADTRFRGEFFCKNLIHELIIKNGS